MYSSVECVDEKQWMECVVDKKAVNGNTWNVKMGTKEEERLRGSVEKSLFEKCGVWKKIEYFEKRSAFLNVIYVKAVDVEANMWRNVIFSEKTA